MSTADAFTAADHVTEREPGPWRDCTFASMLEVCRDGFPDGRDIPATPAEKEALRAAAGLPDDHGGASIGQAITAAERRYGLDDGYFVTTDWPSVRLALLDPGSRCVVQGSMGSVPGHLRRWDPNFSGAHAVAARGNVWCDPLAPQGTYVGEAVPIGTWEFYFRGLPGAQAFITHVGGLTRIEMSIYERRPKTGTFTIPAGKSVRFWRPAGSGWEVVKTWTPVPRPSSASFNAHLARLSGTAVPSSLLAVVDGYGKGLYVSTSDVAEAFDPGPFTQAELDAAYAKGKAEGDVKHTVTLSVGDQPAFTTEV